MTVEVDIVRPARTKFQDPKATARGEVRARVGLRGLETLWFNTGTLCNLACAGCYIESSPRNDRLVYLSRTEVRRYLDEIHQSRLPTRLIGFTGGEPFMNPDLPDMLQDCLERDFDVLVLTNAMKPMLNRRERLLALAIRHGPRLTMRVSLDHYTQTVHETTRGARSWQAGIDGLVWLARSGFHVHVAARRLTAETEVQVREGFARLFAQLGLTLRADNNAELVLFPEMDMERDVPEITEACWDILGRSRDSVMCATSRMVVKHRGAATPTVVACTLLPYDARFDLGKSLADADGGVALNHPYCASFCVLGGAACSRG